jgi:FixJ family two-component response regulator
VTGDTATVFVVDDETSVRQALSEMLRVFGYNVEAYPSAEELLQSLDPRQAASSPTCECPILTASSWFASCPVEA